MKLYRQNKNSHSNMRSNQNELGFLPGELNDKIAPVYRNIEDLLIKLHKIRPCHRIFIDGCEKNGLDKNVIEFLPINYVRGMNLESCILIIEEAHRYVTADNDKFLLGYNIFERIAKEGRKFGVIMDIITQRPVELSENVISQCTNFLIFKITHPTDLEYIRKMVPNISADVIEKQKSLQSGTCVAFGKMMKIPMIVKMQIPNPEPMSANASVYNKWIVMLK